MNHKRFVAMFVGNGEYGVVDTLAPESVKGNNPHGHVILRTTNGMQPVEIAADAMNEKIPLLKEHFDKQYIQIKDAESPSVRQVLYALRDMCRVMEKNNPEGSSDMADIEAFASSSYILGGYGVKV